MEAGGAATSSMHDVFGNKGIGWIGRVTIIARDKTFESWECSEGSADGLIGSESSSSSLLERAQCGISINRDAC